MEDLDSARCSEEACPDWRFDGQAAIREGSKVIDEELFCPLHWPLKQFVVLRAGREARVNEDLARRRLQNQCGDRRKPMTTREWQAWHDFQGQITNFHREHGKLAPAGLRAMGQATWLENFRKDGPLDFNSAVQAALGGEKQLRSIMERLVDAARRDFEV